MENQSTYVSSCIFTESPGSTTFVTCSTFAIIIGCVGPVNLRGLHVTVPLQRLECNRAMQFNDGLQFSVLKCLTFMPK